MSEEHDGLLAGDGSADSGSAATADPGASGSSPSTAEKLGERLQKLLGSDPSSLFWRECLLYTLLIVGTIVWWVWATDGIGFQFLAAFLGSIFLLIGLQYHNNMVPDGEGSKRQPVWGLSLAFFVGALAKIFAVVVDIMLYLALRIMFLDLGNPHEDQGMSMGELLLRVFIMAFIFVALVEELIKFQFLLTFDDSDSELGRSLNIYHPYGVVLVSIALSLGSAGWSIIPNIFAPDHDMPWVYSYWEAILEVPLHAATGALMGVGVARRMFLRETLPAYRILLLPWLLRGLFFLIQMLPFRSSPAPMSPYDVEADINAALGDLVQTQSLDDGTEMDKFQGDIESLASDIGHWLILFYLLNMILVSLASAYAVREVDRLMEDAGDVASSKRQGGGDEL